MAKLKLHNSIEDKDTKTVMEAFFGVESTCYDDIKNFIEAIPEDDENIDIYLHCPGGNCIEGWAMYDALRQSGKKITTVVEGLCASMGTVIMMAAPKERRLAHKNATILIHNPYISGYFQYEEAAKADDLDKLANKTRIQAEELREMQDKIVDLYVERTGASREELQALMDEDRCIGTERAMELGLIGDVLEPNTDKLNSINKTMNEVKVKASVLDRLLAKCGLKSLDEVKCQVITDVTGAEITVDSDEEPKVGDKATPDGEYTMEDGAVMTVADGVITSISRKDDPDREDPDEDEDDEDEDDDDEDEDEKRHRNEMETQIADLTSANETLKAANDKFMEASKINEENMATLKASNETLTASNKALTAEIETLKAAQKSEDEVAILDKVNALGGMDWLDMVEKASSSAQVEGKQFKEHGSASEGGSFAIGADYLAEKRAMRHRS